MLLLIITAIFALACSSSVTSEAQITNELEANPKEVIIKAFELMKQKKSFLIETIASNDETKSETKIVVNASLPDYKTEIFNVDGKKIVEIVCIGKDVYQSMEGKWEKSQKTNFEDYVDNVGEIANLPESIKNAAFVGMEKLNGVNTFLYQYDFDLDAAMEKVSPGGSKRLPNIEIENKVKIWIDESGLPKQIENIRKTEGLKIKVATLRKLQKLNFVENVKIETPKL